jgi:Putative prokaryotic signal transducing protein
MKEVLRTNDMVLVSFVGSLLDDAEIPHLVLDNHMSVVEGSLGILARRVLVGDDFEISARRVLSENGLREHLRPTEI